jgi:hypothetical protein
VLGDTEPADRVFDPHRINAPELVALVRTGAKFVNGRLVERADQEDVA